MRYILVLLVGLLVGCGEEKQSFGLEKGDHLIFLGDSITYLGAQPQGYVSLISEAIAAAVPELGVTVTGKGISGNKVGNLLQRYERDVLKLSPTKVGIFIGTNDVWHWSKPHPVTKEPREGTTQEDYRAGIETLITEFQAAGIRPFLITPAVIGEDIQSELPDTERLEAYVQVVRELAVQHGVPVVDLRSRFLAYLTEHNSENRSHGVLTADRVHLNDAGNVVVCEALCELFGLPVAGQ